MFIVFFEITLEKFIFSIIDQFLGGGCLMEAIHEEIW